MSASPIHLRADVLKHYQEVLRKHGCTQAALTSTAERFCYSVDEVEAMVQPEECQQ